MQMQGFNQVETPAMRNYGIKTVIARVSITRTRW